MYTNETAHHKMCVGIILCENELVDLTNLHSNGD